MMRARVLFALIVTASAPAMADVAAAPPTAAPSSAPRYEQHLNAALPLATPLLDASGRAVQLGDYFATGPVVLVLGYYRCRSLCSVVFDDVLQALARTGMRGLRVVGVSIDPGDTAATASARQQAYRAMLGDAARIDLLTGSAPAVAAVARSAGFEYRYDAAHDQFLHPAGFVIATPDGHVSRYFLGVGYDANAVRAALDSAAAGRSGTLAEQVWLVCTHFDPAAGLHNAGAMAAVRAACAAVFLSLAFWLLRLRRGARP